MSAGDPAPQTAATEVDPQPEAGSRSEARAQPQASTEPVIDGEQAGDPLVRLGAGLLAARQARGLDRATLANQLRMGVEQLEALETADRSRLPELVFVIAQARRVATNLGLDAAPLIEPLRRLEAPAPAAHPGGRARRPLALLAAAALVGLLGTAVWWGLRRPGATAGPASAPVARPLPTGQPPIQRPQAAGGTPAGSSGATTAQLVLRSSGPSWLSVRRADGTTLYEGILDGQRTFPLGRGLQVRAGRPDLVSASVEGGPARILGPIEQIRWQSFRPSAAAAPPRQP